MESEGERFPDAVTGLGTVAHSCRGTGRQGRQGRCHGWAWLMAPGLRGLFTPGGVRPWPVREAVITRAGLPSAQPPGLMPGYGKEMRGCSQAVPQ